MFFKRDKDRNDGGSHGHPEECIDRDTLHEFVEATLHPERAAQVRQHLKSCDLCRRFHGEIETEVSSFALSLSLVWQEENISCPHRDILKAYLAGSLSSGEAAYLEFHLTDVGCAYCNANLEDLRAIGKTEDARYLDGARSRLSQSTSAFLRKS